MNRKQIVSYLFIFSFLLAIGFGCTEQPVEPQVEDLPGGESLKKITPVATWTALENAVNSASAYDIIVLTDNIQFESTLEIKEDITISGGNHTVSESSINSANPLILIKHSGVTITGLKFEGEGVGATPKRNGIVISSKYGASYNNILITSCELYDFNFAAVTLWDSCEATVSFCNIHDNKDGDSYAYGVLLYRGAYANVYDNTFARNWHDIAGDGSPSTGYHAKDNTITAGFQTPSGKYTHRFDMHGYWYHRNKYDDFDINYKFAAGGEIIIESNDFSAVKTGQAIIIRGRPTVGCTIKYNSFGQNWLLTAVRQQLEDDLIENKYDFSKNFGKMYIYKNQFRGSTTVNTLQVSYSGTTSYQQLIDTGFTYDLEDLAFGDFNDDNITDVFFANGTNWYISYGGNTSRKLINTSAYKINKIGFGNFDGNGQTDLVTTAYVDGKHKWYISYDGLSSWTYINYSSYVNIDAMFFDDCDGDGITDIIYTDGSNWIYSKSGTASSWQSCDISWINDGPFSSYNPPSSTPIDIRLDHRRTWKDFNGDTITDSFIVD